MGEPQDCREEVQRNIPMTDSIGVGMTTGEHQSVTIRHAENGFIVDVGCKTFVSKDWLEVSSKLQEYWKNPRRAEKEFYK